MPLMNFKFKSTTITTYDTRDNSENTTEPFYGSSEEYTDGIIVTKYRTYRKKLVSIDM